MTVKLLDKDSKDLVDFEPGAVNAAVQSGRFLFPKDRGVPVRVEGKEAYVTPQYAAKYRDRLLFVNDEDVERARAEERFKGIGGAAQALGYGAVKGLTLGAVPALAASISPEAAEYSRQIELGRPVLTTAGEVGGLLVDPFAAAGKVLGRGAVAGREAVAAAEAAGRAAPRAALAERLAAEAPVAEVALGRPMAPVTATPTAVAALGREAPLAAPVARGIRPSVDPGVLEAEFTENVAPLAVRRPMAEPMPAAPQLHPARGLGPEVLQAEFAKEAGLTVPRYAEAEAMGARPMLGAGRGLGPAGPGVLEAEFAPEVGLAVPRYVEAEAAGVPPQMLGAGRVPAGTAEELRLGGAAPAAARAGVTPTVTEAAMPMPAAGAPAAQGRGFAIPADVASMAAQGGLYGASEEARRQATGESAGGLGAVLGAGAIGAALPAGMMLGGKAMAKGAVLGSKAANEPGLLQKIAGGAETLEKQHIARAFDISKDQVTRLNNKFDIPELQKRGTDVFTKFIKNELDDVDRLKAAFPDDAFLQSIPTGTKLKFGQLTPDRKKAFADAVERFYGQQYDNVFTDAVNSAQVDNSILQNVINRVKATRVAGAPQEGLQSVMPELNALEKYMREGGQYNVGSLKSLQSRIGENFRALQGEGGKFTESQAAMYGGLKNAIYDAAEAVQPGAAAQLAQTDMAYEMSKILSEGANRVLSKATTTSPVGRDLLSQFALGVAAVGHPFAATKFFLATVGLRHLYNTRGEGIIADLAGKLSTRLMDNPAAVAKEASSSILNAKRPMLLGANAMQLTSAEPGDYTAMSKAVRDLQASREKTMNEVQRAVSSLPPDQQQKAIQNFDTVVNALASELPKGLALEKSLSEQERRYMVFARSVLDPAYGTQVLVNGGPDSSEAAKAFASLGPAGQEYLTKLADNLRDQINESEKLRGDMQYVQAYRNIKSKTSVTIGGGRAAALHAPSAPRAAGTKAAPMVSPAVMKAMAGSLTGMEPRR